MSNLLDTSGIYPFLPSITAEITTSVSAIFFIHPILGHVLLFFLSRD